jgi:hypothetical protein
MNPGALLWIVVFLASILLFFGVAIYLGLAGYRDLRRLLRREEEEAGRHG